MAAQAGRLNLRNACCRVVHQPVGQIYPGTLEQLPGGFDVTLNLLLGLMGGAALTRLDK
jgi:hypothetical protein